jgi:hypothetical protein
VTDCFQDGRRHHFGNSSAFYKMGNYHPILIKFDTRTETDMLSSNITKAEVQANFQDGRCRHIGNSSACYKMGNCRPILLKFVTQTKTDMLSLTITKAVVYGKETPKIKCKKTI